MAPEITTPAIPGGGRVNATSRVAGEGGDPSVATRGGGVASAGSRTVGSGSASGGAGAAADGVGLGLGAREGNVLALAFSGDGSGAGSEYDAYVALLRRRVQDSLAYPPAARRRELRGTVQVVVDVQPTGAITHVALAVSSSHRVLDEAALEAARGVDRVPFPPNLRPRPLRVRLPVVFVPY